MHHSLLPYEERTAKGLLRKVEKGPLVLYNYTDMCTFERAWDEYTLNARGIIFEKETGKIVARPFPKFFNLGETESTFLDNLPNNEYIVSEKLDGSLGIIYHYDNKWNVATRGSFSSDQAIEAESMLSMYDLSNVDKDLTLLAEIIYPSNKIIVNYGDARELVLLGAINKDNKKEFKEDRLNTGMRVAPTYNYTIKEMVELQKTLPKDSEGFVVRFAGGFRVKVKGFEYLRIAKLLSYLSPIALWECMKDGIVQSEYLIQIPEEYRNEWEPIKESLEQRYTATLSEIKADQALLPTKELSVEGKKTIGLFIEHNRALLKHPEAVFPFLLGRHEKYLMKAIRPTGNKL